MQDVGTQIKLLVDTLIRKKQLLEELLAYTKEQADLLKQPKPDMEAFKCIMSNKQIRIGLIQSLDDGFQASYDRVKHVITSQPVLYKSAVQEMKTRIKEINNLGISIQVQEERNRRSLVGKSGEDKQETKSFQTHKNVMQKYQNVSKSQKQAVEPRFIDSKK